MEQITTKTIKIDSVIDIDRFKPLLVLNATNKVDIDKLTVEFTVNKSPITACWRLVHNGHYVLALFEGDAGSVTGTVHNLFCGTEEECRQEIKKLGLKTK